MVGDDMDRRILSTRSLEGEMHVGYEAVKRQKN